MGRGIGRLESPLLKFEGLLAVQRAGLRVGRRLELSPLTEISSGNPMTLTH